MKSGLKCRVLGDTRRQNITVIHNKVAPAECNAYTDAQEKRLLQPPLTGASSSLSPAFMTGQTQLPENRTAT